jgi:putative nucleotidyltransferase with HDIG domain
MPQTLSAKDVLEIFPEAAEIRDESLRTKVIDIWREIAAEMPWDNFYEIPQNVRGESGRNLVNHIRGVTQTALGICETAQRVQNKPYDRDLLTAACLLHDVSKPVEMEPVPGTPRGLKPCAAQYSAVHKNLQHALYASHKALAKGLPLNLVHIIVTHTHESRRRGQSWEAAALFYADYADIDAGLSAASKPLFLQRWRLDA